MRPKARGRDTSPLVYIGGAVVITAVMFSLQFWNRSKQLNDSAGSPKRAFVVGSWLVLVDKMIAGSNGRYGIGKAWGTRLSAIELQTGKPAAPSKLFQDQTPTCWPAGADRVWCEENGELSVLKVPTFEQLGSVPQLLSSSGREKAAKDMYTPTDAGLAITLLNGKAVEIASDTLAVSDWAGKLPDSARQPEVRCRTDSAIKIDDGRLELEGNAPKRTVVFRAKSSPRDTPGSLEFLGKGARPEFVRLNTSEFALVEHSATLEDDAPMQLSRLDPRGTAIAWTVAPGAGSCQLAEIVDGKLLFATTDGKNRAMAIDPQTGKVLWKFSFSAD